MVIGEKFIFYKSLVSHESLSINQERYIFFCIVLEKHIYFVPTLKSSFSADNFFWQVSKVNAVCPTQWSHCGHFFPHVSPASYIDLAASYLQRVAVCLTPSHDMSGINHTSQKVKFIKTPRLSPEPSR